MTDDPTPAATFARCPQCGGDAITKTRQMLACRDCDYEYYFNVAAAVAAIIELPDGNILLTRRAKDPAAGTLDLPGGFVDFGESAETALRREVTEELALTLGEMRYYCSLPNRYRYAGVTYHTLDLVFICPLAGIDGIAALDDVAGFELRRPESVRAEEIGLDSIRKIVEKYARETSRSAPFSP